MTPTRTPVRQHQVALITGANKGIGKEIARQLGAAGITVLVAARDPERGNAAAAELREGGADVRALVLDVTDEASVTSAARRVAAEVGALDILVNNAGITRDRGRLPSELPLEDLRAVYDTNVVGVVAVTNAMLPLLRRSPAARVVNVTSGLGSLTLASAVNDLDDAETPFPMLLAYNSSKTALNSVTVQYANELRDTPIKVNAACPGYCATDLNGFAGHRAAAQGAAIAVRLATLSADGPSGAFLNEDVPLPW